MITCSQCINVQWGEKVREGVGQQERERGREIEGEMGEGWREGKACARGGGKVTQAINSSTCQFWLWHTRPAVDTIYPSKVHFTLPKYLYAMKHAHCARTHTHIYKLHSIYKYADHILRLQALRIYPIDSVLFCDYSFGAAFLLAIFHFKL